MHRAALAHAYATDLWARGSVLVSIRSGPHVHASEFSRPRQCGIGDGPSARAHATDLRAAPASSSMSMCVVQTRPRRSRPQLEWRGDTPLED